MGTARSTSLPRVRSGKRLQRCTNHLVSLVRHFLNAHLVVSCESVDEVLIESCSGLLRFREDDDRSRCLTNFLSQETGNTDVTCSPTGYLPTSVRTQTQMSTSNTPSPNWQTNYACRSSLSAVYIRRRIERLNTNDPIGREGGRARAHRR